MFVNCAASKYFLLLSLVKIVLFPYNQKQLRLYKEEITHNAIIKATCAIQFLPKLYEFIPCFDSVFNVDQKHTSPINVQFIANNNPHILAQKRCGINFFLIYQDSTFKI